MRISAFVLSAAALLTLAMAGDAEARHGRSFGGFGGPGRGPIAGGDGAAGDGGASAETAMSARMERHRMKRGFVLARLADTDEDGGVSAEERAAFLDSLVVGADGAVDLDDLAARLPARPDGSAIDVERLGAHLDVDDDGVIDVDDIAGLFDALDANGDGDLMSFETRRRRRLRGRARRRGAALLRAADADESGDVTVEEWAALIDSLGADADGVITGDAVLALLPVPEDGERPDDAAERIERRLDRDRDGVLEIEDIEEILAHFDDDADGALSEDEMPHARR